MKNNSYVCIPANKLAEIIEHCCPPETTSEKCCCFGLEKDCITCWHSWLKDGVSNG